MPSEQKPGQSDQPGHTGQPAGQKADPSQAGNKPTSRKQEKSGTEFPLSNPLGEIFTQNANLWFATHAELLTNVDALTHAWLSRRRDGVDSMREAIQQMTELRNPADMLRIQQQWLSDALRRASEDIAGLNDGIASMTQKAATNFEQAARKVAEPLHVVGEEMLKAAGNKPHGGRSGGPGIDSPRSKGD